MHPLQNSHHPKDEMKSRSKYIMETSEKIICLPTESTEFQIQGKSSSSLNLVRDRLQHPRLSGRHASSKHDMFLPHKCGQDKKTQLLLSQGET